MARIDGGPSRDILYGTGFEDELYGLGGNDLLRARAGNDRIDGGTGADVMVGWTGNDTYYIDHVGDRIAERAGQGVDTVVTSIALRLQPDQAIENIILVGDVRAVVSNDLANRITVDQETRVSNILDGGRGADFMDGGPGSDFFIVDDSNDRPEEDAYFGEVDVVIADVSYVLADRRADGGLNYIENLVLRGSEAVDGTGNSRGNTIKGTDADNVLRGLRGRDTLIGGTGDDSLYGGGSVDTLFGGEGNDGFYFEELVSGVGFLDYVRDFSSADDTIFLDRAAFTEIGAGVLDPEAFAIGAEPQEQDDRIVYEPDTGRVIYDSNGSAEGGDRGLFMIVPANAQLDHTDFVGYG